VTILVHHRANSISQGSLVAKTQGAEIDLRLSFGEIVLAHDPFTEGSRFIDWLEKFNGELLVLNVKEMGLEDYIIKIMKKLKPNLNYFFLDLVTPYLVSSVKKGFDCASRFSEYEPLHLSLDLNSSWLWVDSFSGNWDHIDVLNSFPKLKHKKICLVSPELQGRELLTTFEYEIVLRKLEKSNCRIEAICTKYPDFWERFIS
jgi:hypothetical protein